MLNKRGGWKKFQKLINGEVPIRAWRVEKVSKINKRASLFIRQVRVVAFIEGGGKKMWKYGAPSILNPYIAPVGS